MECKVERINIAPSGKRFKSHFIVPGLISYRDQRGGVDLVKKQTIDLCLNSMVGAVLTIGHPSKEIIVSRNWTDVAHGRVDKVGYDEASGFYVAEGTVETDAARERINEGYGTSCGFTVLESAGPGTWGQIPYTQEDTRIEFHHLALVENPRIEEADIRLNAKKPMNIAKWIKTKIVGDKPTEEAHELPLDAKIDLGEGRTATIQEMIDAERANAVHVIAPDDYIEHEGIRYHAKTLIDHFRANAMRCNDKGAETPEQKKAREDQERQNAQAAADKKLADEKAVADKAIADRIAQEKAAREEQERENAKKRGQESFRILQEAQKKGTQRETPDYSTGMSGSLDDGVALGRERYGKPVGSRAGVGRN